MVKRILHIGLDGMNLPLLRRFVSEDVLTNFQQLIEQGTINRLLPSIPAWTPTNWTAQVTGAEPGTHGLAGWERRQKNQSWDTTRIQSWEYVDWQAETIWEVAEESGYKSMITHFPVATWPSPIKNGYIVAPGFRTPPLVIAHSMEYFCRISEQEVTEDRTSKITQQRLSTVDRAEEGLHPGSTILTLSPAKNWRNTRSEAWSCELPIPHNDGQSELTLQLLVTPSSSGNIGNFIICEIKDLNSRLVKMELGKWTDFIISKFSEEDNTQEGSFRFRLLEVSPEEYSFRFCRSQVYSIRGFTYPTSLGEELLENIGPFFLRYSVEPKGDVELNAFLDEHRYQGLWEARAAKYVLNKYGWDLHFSHWHIFDDINHFTINPADPHGPNYDPEISKWNLNAQKQTYQVADEVLGEFLKLSDNNTYVLVISDHAMAPAHRWCDVDVLLAQKGLMVYKKGGREIDRSKSRVYTLATRGSEIFINLKKREPFGIVSQHDYETVQEEIIDALLDWRDPLTGKRAVALALKLQDAQIIGYWGKNQGDIVFTYNRGFGWGEVYERGIGDKSVTNRPSIGPGRGALHGSQIPTSETPFFSNMGCMIMTGPDIKQGYERDWKRYGLMREIDIASTLCHILELRPPAQNRGAVLYDIFD